MSRTALVLVPPAGDTRKVTGLDLGERARRVAVRAGVAGDRVVLVRTADELRAARGRLVGPLLLLRATDQVVAAPLVDALEPARPGTRIAVDPARGGQYAGALVVDGERATALLDALADDLAAGDARALAGWDDATRVEVGPRARHPAGTPDELRAARRWQWELINKSLDAPITRYFYRPLGRPLTHLFLRIPWISPNAISVLSAVLSIGGCVLAAGPSPTWHVLGLFILVIGGIVDCNDGEVARLRLESSTAGAWLDAIGDDLARISLIVALGLHLQHLHPGWPMVELGIAAAVITLLALIPIYWYCATIAHSANTQEYTRALNIGPGVRASDGRTAVDVIVDWATQLIRRDMIDLGAAVLAIFALSEITFSLLGVGAVVTLLVVAVTHTKIVRARRAQARTAS